MKIDFNFNDYNLSAICRESKLFNLETDNSFRIYGLRTEGNPAIWLEYGRNMTEEKMNQLKDFFGRNGILVEFERVRDDRTIRIGLRKDLRGQAILCGAILQTIIYFLEDRMDLPEVTLPGIPRRLNRNNQKSGLD